MNSSHSSRALLLTFCVMTAVRSVVLCRVISKVQFFPGKSSRPIIQNVIKLFANRLSPEQLKYYVTASTTASSSSSSAPSTSTSSAASSSQDMFYYHFYVSLFYECVSHPSEDL